jgi:hypothetical protein
MDIDEKSLKKLLNGIKAKVKKKVQVGWFQGVNSNVQNPDTRYTNTAAMARFQYFGDKGSNVPPRPFFQHLYTIRRFETTDILKDIAKKQINGIVDLQSEANRAGKLVADIINDFDTPSNSEFTIEMKGDDNPLVETGNLKDSVVGRVI